MSAENHLANRFILPQLKLIKFDKVSNKTFKLHCIKTTTWEVCRKCPTKSYSVHDKRSVSIRDAKLYNKNIKLIITKRRFRCPKCKCVFTENVDGTRTTEGSRVRLGRNYPCQLKS